MEKKNNILVIILVIIIVLILGVGGYLFVSGKVVFNNEINSNDTTKEESSTNNDSYVLSESEATAIIHESTDRLFNFMYSWNVYCGDNMIYDESTKITKEEYDYYVSHEFKTESELNEYLKKYFSAEIIEKFSKEDSYVTEKYIEKDEKLYCLNLKKGCGLTYNKSETTYVITKITDTEIEATGKISYNSCETENDFINSKIILEKNQNKWVITEYSDDSIYYKNYE